MIDYTSRIRLKKLRKKIHPQNTEIIFNHSQKSRK